MRIMCFVLGFSILLSTARADEQSSSLETMEFRLSEERMLIPARVVNVNAQGDVKVQIREPDQRDHSALVEGLYLAIAFKQKKDLGDSLLLRLSVKEVLPDDQALIQIEKSAVDKFENIQQLFLFRPIGSTTASLKAAPSIAPLLDESERIEGMADSQFRSLQKSKQHLKQIGLALNSFHDSYKYFPPAAIKGPDGKSWHSWRVLLLPYLGQVKLYERYRFDEPWNGPNNKMLITQMPEVFHDPVYGVKTKKGYTSYAAVVGADAGFVTAKFNGQKNDLGRAIQQGTSIRTFLDGSTNTVLVGSISPKSEIPWTKPEDIALNEKTPALGKENGFATPYDAKLGQAGLFVMCDGSVQTIRADIEKEQFRRLLQRNDGMVVGSIPSLNPDQPQNAQRVLVFTYRRTDQGIQAVLRYTFITPEQHSRRNPRSAAEGEKATGTPKNQTPSE